MQIIQLYIQGQRVDLFKDESVTITDSIQNVKDIDKIFTSFSQSFSIPASKKNNKIFKHYYNFDIENGFDARVKVDATIELNNLSFKNGKIKLEGVDLKNNVAHTYRITFFGDIVDLKDKLGERKLNSLNNLSSYNLIYDETEVYNRLTVDPTTTDVIAPLITHSQRLYYDSVSHNNTKDGNLYYHNGAHYHGVYWNQLKYALRVNRIIEAIEEQYDLKFSTDFFKNASVEEMNNMFMWLHRKSGAVEDLSGGTEITTLVTGWTNNYYEYFYIYDDFLEILNKEAITTLLLYVVPSNPSIQYSVDVQLYGESVYQSGNVTGSLGIDLKDTIVDYAVYQIYITTSGVLSFNNIQWQIAEFVPDTDLGGGFYYLDNTTFSSSGVFLFNINRQMPDIKIIDFLSGLFKMFNLTAYVDNGIIVVKKLDDFYASSTNSWDITKFVEQNNSKVDVALPYREIIFKFQDTGYFLANKFSQLNNRNWGELLYNQGSTDLAGSLYKVEVPFGHMLFERLVDPNGNVTKDIQYGYCVNESQSAYLGAPLLFYPVRKQTAPISFVNSFDSDGMPNGHLVTNYANLPFNSVSDDPTLNNFQLNFNKEFSEWTLADNFTSNLYNDYYNNYILSVFNSKNRLTKLSAYLPSRILLNYTLADRFIISGNSYKINSITTNLETGKSELELLNDL
jgi:hypothetical protein